MRKYLGQNCSGPGILGRVGMYLLVGAITPN